MANNNTNTKNKLTLPQLSFRNKVLKISKLDIPQIDHSMKLNRNYSVNKQTTLPSLELVPKHYNERILFIAKIFEKEELMQICTNAPLRVSSKPKDIGIYLASKLKSKIEICAALILYLNINFTVDTNTNTDTTTQPKKMSIQSPDEVFKSGIGLSEGLTRLYQSMAFGAGIKVEVISGFLKPFGYQNGDVRSKHYWCLVKIGALAFIIDPSLAMGYINKANAYEPMLRPYYFLTPPEYLIDTHRPEIDKFQLLEKPLTVKAFTEKRTLDIGLFVSNIYHYKITLHEMAYSNQLNILTLNHLIKISIPYYDLTIELHKENQLIEPNCCTITYQGFSDTYAIKVIFPSYGDYSLIIKGIKTGSNKDKKNALELLKFNCIVNNKKKNDTEKKVIRVPNYLSNTKRLNRCASELTENNVIKNKCYDNKGAVLYEPKNVNLKIGQETRFKVKVKDAAMVVLFDGRNKQSLKKTEDNIYEGIFPVINKNLVLCSLKKTCNIYTEVFEFSAVKD